MYVIKKKKRIFKKYYALYALKYLTKTYKINKYFTLISFRYESIWYCGLDCNKKYTLKNK